jgi:ribose transport system permease protein
MKEPTVDIDIDLTTTTASSEQGPATLPTSAAPDGPSDGPSAVPGRGIAHRLRTAFSTYSLVVVLAAVSLLFAVLDPTVFATLANARTIGSTNATIALLALAAMLPLAVGQFDISVGFQFGLAQGLCAGLLVEHGIGGATAVIVVLAAGLLVGLVNGLLVAVAGLDSFIATLAVGILVLGATQWFTGSVTISGTLPGWMLDAGRGSVAGVPAPVVYVVLAAGLLWALMEYTSWGRHAYASGGNAKAARLAGVPVQRVTIQAFVGTGLLCAVAGILSVSVLGASSPVVGLGALLPAFAGAFLGATSIRPGRFNAFGTVVAVYLVAVGITGLRQQGAAPYVEQLFYGLALLVAVVLARVATRTRA